MSVAIVAFSKDRAMQCDAMIRSFDRHVTSTNLKRIVLYKPTDARTEEQYLQLSLEHKQWLFIRESSFREQVKHMPGLAEFLLFCVDDTIWTGKVDLDACEDELYRNGDAIGVSFRLGRNASHNYPGSRRQTVPHMVPDGHGLMEFDWTTSDGDFCWSLELSSSLYRSKDVAPMLEQCAYANPNTLEDVMSCNRAGLAVRNKLLCYETSVAFSVPANKVQDSHNNRSGSELHLSAKHLADEFDKGKRIDVARFDGFVSKGCHQEVDLVLV